jgi:hypothetical protein
MNPDGGTGRNLRQMLRQFPDSLAESSTILAVAHHLPDPIGKGEQQPDRQQRAINQIHAGIDILTVAAARSHQGTIFQTIGIL